ncbi:homoserine kinase [Arsenicicoccus cauae]|uniref:homoserine kinase n=1 Tax=Arsenicicoccus cauae TaxID=2663847 RepID=UPI00289FD7E6|nr:homoserine kinase [Arsenicicoccus cauae]
MASVTALPEGAAVRVNVPGSSANLGPGFDAIGLALGVWDSYDVVVEGDALVIDVTGESADEVPRDASHLVHRCLASGLARLGVDVPAGLHLVCRNGVPHSRGLGSSATAVVAGYAAATALVDLARGGEGAVDLDLVNQLAGEHEGHPDNSSASVYGGMTLSWSTRPPAMAPVRTVQVEVHPDVVPVVLVPDLTLSTSTARSVLPQQVPLKHAALNSARAALLVEAVSRRPELLLDATVEWLHQEQRREAYPASMRLLDQLRELGHAAVVSGAGPTVLVLTTADRVGEVRALPLPQGWRSATPGIPTVGVSAVRLGVSRGAPPV